MQHKFYNDPDLKRPEMLGGNRNFELVSQCFTHLGNQLQGAWATGIFSSDGKHFSRASCGGESLLAGAGERSMVSHGH